MASQFPVSKGASGKPGSSGNELERENGNGHKLEHRKRHELEL